MKRSRVRIGISGWQYAGWRGVFYPPGLVQAHELTFASRAMQTIEINGSHYALQRPASYQRWHDDTPDDFVFSVKAPRYLTHILRLQGDAVPVALANFFASGIFNLRAKLGPLLWQFPPSMVFKPEVFESFLQLLPHDTEAAARFGHRESPPGLPAASPKMHTVYQPCGQGHGRPATCIAILTMTRKCGHRLMHAG